MAGIEEYDYLSDQAENALKIFQGVRDSTKTADSTLSSVETGLDSIFENVGALGTTIAGASGNLGQAISLLESGDTAGALSLIDTAQNTLSLTENSLATAGNTIATVKRSVSGVRAGCAALLDLSKQGIDLVNVLVHMIDDAKRKIAGDLKTWNYYQCKVCSFNCTSKYKFKPKEGSVFLVTCALDQSPTAKYEFTHSETEGKTDKEKDKEKDYNPKA
jgi:hypothetical protein